MARDKNNNVSPDSRPEYESPVMIPLGELASGWGGCLNGTVAKGNCNLGFTVDSSNCNYGNDATVQCNSGTTASTTCVTGTLLTKAGDTTDSRW